MACELYCAPGATETAGVGFKSSLLALTSHASALVASKNSVFYHSWDTKSAASSAASNSSLSCPVELDGLEPRRILTLPTAFMSTELVSTPELAPGAFAVGSACGRVWLGTHTEQGETAELGHASIGESTAGPSHSILSAASGGVFAAAHSSSMCARLLSLPAPGRLELSTAFSTQLPNAVTCTAAIHAPSMANAPILAAGCAQGGCIWDVRAKGSTAAQEGKHVTAAASIAPTSGNMVHMKWCGDWGVVGGLVTMSSSGIVELWEPRTWRVAEQWRAPAKYSTTRLAASSDAKYVWSAGTDNDILGGQLALGELGVAVSPGSWKVSRGGAGPGRSVNKGGYTGPNAQVDNTPDRIKEGRRKGFHGGARWVGMDVLCFGSSAPGSAAAQAGQDECTLAALTEKGQLYIVRNAHQMG